MRPTDKYKMFRNFMVNELGITREDIRSWTEEAIASEVRKLVGQIDVEGLIKRNIKDVSGISEYYISNKWDEVIKQEIAKIMNENMRFEYAPSSDLTTKDKTS